MTEHVIHVFALVALLGVATQWLAWRIRLPAIVLLTAFGVLAGPVLGWIQPSRDLGALLDPLVKAGVAVILFEGGLTLRFHELRQAGAGVARLVTLGVLLSFPLGAAAAHYLGGLSWPVALTFGAIIVVTGPTVIIPLLRQARLQRRPASYLRWEGILNDPIGALLAVLVFEYFTHAAGEEALRPILVQLAAGLLAASLLGVGIGFILGVLYRRGFVPEYLKGPGALAAALGVYAAANLVLEESGLLAATLLGITLSNLRLPSIDEIRRFKEYIALLLVSGVFILLTADLQPGILLQLDWRSAVLLAAVMFVLRPVTIFVSTIGAGMTLAERALLAWIAPRGIVAAAVAGVFGPALAQQGYAGAELLLPLIFALIFLTVVAHGVTIGPMARALGLSARRANGVLIVGASPWTVGLAQVLKDKEIPVMIADNSWHRLRPARLAGIKVYYGEILSETAEQQLELNEYGTLLAATDNDAYNSLVCSRFAVELGRQHVFQLPDVSAEEPDPKRLARSVRGQIAPVERAYFEELVARWYRGWTFQKTPLSESYTYEACQASCPPESIPVLALKNDGGVLFNSVEQPMKPKPGDTVIWFGPKPEKTRAAKNEAQPRQAGAGKP